jgi:prophage regulatory protein
MQNESTSATSSPVVPPRLLRFKDVFDRVHMSRTQIWRLEQAGLFPSPVRLSHKVVLWSEAEINTWIDRRLESRKGTTAA